MELARAMSGITGGRCAAVNRRSHCLPTGSFGPSTGPTSRPAAFLERGDSVETSAASSAMRLIGTRIFQSISHCANLLWSHLGKERRRAPRSGNRQRFGKDPALGGGIGTRQQGSEAAWNSMSAARSPSPITGSRSSGGDHHPHRDAARAARPRHRLRAGQGRTGIDPPRWQEGDRSAAASSSTISTGIRRMRISSPEAKGPARWRAPVLTTERSVSA